MTMQMKKKEKTSYTNKHMKPDNGTN